MMALVMLLPLPDLEAESDMASDEGWDAAGGMAAGPWMAAADDWVGDGKCLEVGKTTVAGGSLAYCLRLELQRDKLSRSDDFTNPDNY